MTNNEVVIVAAAALSKIIFASCAPAEVARNCSAVQTSSWLHSIPGRNYSPAVTAINQQNKYYDCFKIEMRGHRIFCF